MNFYRTTVQKHTNIDAKSKAEYTSTDPNFDTIYFMAIDY